VAIILGGISCLWLLQVAAAPMTGGSTGKRGTAVHRANFGKKIRGN